MNETLQLLVNAKADGVDQVDRLGSSLARMPALADRAGKSLADSGAVARAAGGDYLYASDSALKHAGSLMRATEAAAAFIGTHALASRALAEYSAQAGAGVSATNALIDTYRVARIALSPTLFTAASLGVGILAEETLKLVSARGKLIEQEALIAARSGVPAANVDRVGAISRLSGANSGDLIKAMAALQAGAGTSQSSSALNTLGVPKYFQDASSPQLLVEIAKGLASIPDPAARAKAAVDLFGGDLAEKVLPQLNQQFADSARAVDDWGLTLDKTGRDQIYRLSRDMSNLKAEILSLGTNFEAAGARIAQSLELGAAKSYDFLQGLRTATEFQRRNAADAAMSAPVSDAERGRILEFANRQFGAKTAAGLSKNAAGLLQGSVLSSMDAASRTRAGVEAELSQQRSAQAAAEAVIKKGGLSSDEQRDAYAQYQAASQGVARSTSTLKGFDEARRQQDALLRSRELLNRSAVDPTAGRDLRGELQKATTFVDSEGAVQQYKMLDETRRNIEAAFHAYRQDLQQKASRDQIKNDEEAFRADLRFDEEREVKRRAYITETAQLELSTMAKTAAQGNVTLGYGRDQQLRSAELLGMAPPRTLRAPRQDAGDYAGQRDILEAQTGLAQIKRKTEILTSYVQSSALNDAADIERSQQMALIGVAAALKAGNVSPEAAAGRYRAIYAQGGEAGTALNDKYAADLLQAQQDGVIETARVLQGLSDKNVERLQAFIDRQTEKVASLAGGIFDAVTSRTLRAVPNFFKNQALDFGKTVSENAARDYLAPLLRSYLPTSGSSLLKGTIFESAPGGDKPATELLLTAGTSLQTAASDLTAAARVLAGYGGGGPAGAGGVAGGSLGTDVYGNAIPSITPAPLSGTMSQYLRSLPGLGSFSSGVGSVTSGDALSILTGKAVLTGGDGSAPLSMQIGAGIGLAGALATGGYGIASGLTQGGVGGDLKAAGSAAGIAASAVSNIAKLMGAASPLLSAIPVVGSLAAIALPLIGGLFNGPQQRTNAINQELSQNQYIAPQAMNVTQSSGGTFADFDAKGNLRTSDLSPYPQERQGFVWEQTHGLFGGPPTFYNVPGAQISQFGAPVASPAPVVNNHYWSVNAVDAPSVQNLLTKYAGAVGSAAAKALQDGHGSLTAEVQRAANP